MKDGVIIVNTSRSALIVTQAAIEALKRQKIRRLLCMFTRMNVIYSLKISLEVIQDYIYRRLSSCRNMLLTGHQALKPKRK